MEAPTPDALRARSELLTQRFPDPTGDAALTKLIEEAAPLAAILTGRAIGVPVGELSPTGCTFDPVPAWMVPMVERALAMLAEGGALTGTVKARKSAIGSVRLKSINAGPWGESYFGPEEAAKAKVLNPDPLVHGVLWTLATDCTRRYWLMLWGEGTFAPASAVQSFDYGRRTRRSRGY